MHSSIGRKANRQGQGQCTAPDPWQHLLSHFSQGTAEGKAQSLHETSAPAMHLAALIWRLAASCHVTAYTLQDFTAAM